MSDGGLAVLDGTHLLNADLRLPLPDATINGSQIVELCESEASAHLFGLSLPEHVRSGVIRRLNCGDDGDFLSKEFGDEESKKKMVKKYLLALADELKDDPLVISILDGQALRVFMDDEDDFAMLAEDIFTDLDVDDRGKLSKNDIQKALVHMGVGMGVPPLSESRDLLNYILKKHDAEGEEQLGQSQFAQLLQSVIQDLADALTKKNVIVRRKIKVINGSRLKKILADEKLLNSVIEWTFQDWVAAGAAGDNKVKLQDVFESKGPELGLPPSDCSEAVAFLYEQIFTDVGDKLHSGNLSRGDFEEVVKVILKNFATQLEGNPAFLDLES